MEISFEGMSAKEAIAFVRALKSAELAATNSQQLKPKIPSFEVMWQRISQGQPKPNGFLDAVAADTAKMSAAIMYDALIMEMLDTSGI